MDPLICIIYLGCLKVLLAYKARGKYIVCCILYVLQSFCDLVHSHPLLSSLVLYSLVFYSHVQPCPPLYSPFPSGLISSSLVQSCHVSFSSSHPILHCLVLSRSLPFGLVQSCPILSTPPRSRYDILAIGPTPLKPRV